MENTKYGKRREGRWIPIRAKAQDTTANPNSWETHLVRKRWDIGLLRALSLRIMMMMNYTRTLRIICSCQFPHRGFFDQFRLNETTGLDNRLTSTEANRDTLL